MSAGVETLTGTDVSTSAGMEVPAGLSDLITKAARRLASATTSAEVLDAREMAGAAVDAGKRAARLAKAKQAHDDILEHANRATADALVIEARAKMRLADEYDEAQRRGEVHRHGGQKPRDVSNENIPSAADAGLSRKEIHDARKLRDAENADPGSVERSAKAMVAEKVPPSRAELQRRVTGEETKPLVPLGGRSAKEFNTAMHFVGGLEGALRSLKAKDSAEVATLLPKQVEEARSCLLAITSETQRLTEALDDL